MGGWAQIFFLSRQSHPGTDVPALSCRKLESPIASISKHAFITTTALDTNFSTLWLALCYPLILGTVSSSIFLQFNIFWISERGCQCLVLPKILMVLRGAIHLQNYFPVSWVQQNGKLMRQLPCCISYTKLSHHHWDRKKAWKDATEISAISRCLCPQGRT